MTGKKNIVILGAGFGGIAAARDIGARLKNSEFTDRYRVVIIDRNAHHTYTPVLYEIATTSKTTAAVNELLEISTHPVPKLIKGLPIEFIQGEIETIDLKEGDVHLKDGQKIPSDYLVFAMGSETNYFGIKGLKEHALPMKTFLDAVRIRDTIWSALMEGRESLNIVVGGAGSTGVELAGELTTWCKEMIKNFPNCHLSVTLVEAGQSILPGFPPRVVEKACARFKKLGVNLLINKMIAEAHPTTLIFKDGTTLPYDILIWTGGVKASELLTTLSLKTEPRGRMEVGIMMTCLPETPSLRFHPMIYGIGDAICIYDPTTKKPMPGVARAAIDQAHVAAHNLIEEIRTNEIPGYKVRPMTYTPKQYPYILPIGGKYAIAKLGFLVISGFWGWVLKGLVELNYLFSIMPPLRAIRIWLKGLRIFIKNDCLG